MMTTSIGEAWNQALEEQRKKLGKYQFLADSLSFDDFEMKMQKMQGSYHLQSASQCINRLIPIFQQLNSFNKSLTVIASANSGASMVWGLLLILVKGACEYAKLLEEFSNMIDGLTTTVTRMNRYLQILPKNLELQYLSVSIIEDYVGCCINAFKFYHKRATVNFSRVLFWSSLRRDFKVTQDKIASKIVTFEKEIRVNIDEILLNHVLGEHPDSRVPSSLFSVPYGQNEFFCGRDKTLEQIDSIFSKHLSFEQPSCLIHAMGGMGKTQVALAYAHQRRDKYNYIFWLASQKETELASNFSELATKLGFPEAQNLGQGRKANMVRQWLESTDFPWLVIFDNVESMESIRQYWPSRSSNGSILVTSQIKALTQAFKHHIALQPLGENEGTSLLLEALHLSSISDTERRAAAKIVKLIGGLPIAISHIAGSIFSTGLSLQEAVSMFEKQKYSDLWSGRQMASTHIYEQRLDMVWDIALNELSQAEMHLLHILSFLNPDAIQENIILMGQDIGIFESNFDEVFLRVRSDLARRQLVQRNSSGAAHYLSLHRSLQLNLRARLFQNKVDYANVFNEAVFLVRNVFPAQHKAMSVENHHWASYAIYSPHVQALQLATKANNESIEMTPVFAQLLSDSANYYWEKGFLKLGVETCQLAVSIFERLPHLDPIAYSQPLTLWGLMAGEMGISYRGKETFDPLVKCLNIRATYLETAPGGGDMDEQLLYGNAWGDICCACIDAGYYDEVEKYANINLAIKSGVASEKTHAMFFGSAYMHLAHAYIGQKRFLEAKAFVARCRKMAAIDYEPHTAAYQKFVFFEACILKETGDLNGALTLHKQVLEKRLDLFGPFENNTRYSCYALGEIYHMIGDLDKAEKMLKRSLDSLDRSSWTDFGAEGRSSFRLARVLRDLKPNPFRPETASLALDYETKAVACWKKLMPHPEEIFEGPIKDLTSYFDLMVPFTGRTRFGHDQVRKRKLEDQIKIPNRVAHLQYIPAYTYWDPADREAFLSSKYSAECT